MRTILAIAVLLVASTTQAEDCNDITWVERTTTVIVPCTEIVPRVNCVEKIVQFERPVDAECKEDWEKAPEGAVEGPVECADPTMVQDSKTVLVQCSDLWIHKTCKQVEVKWMEPVNDPNCVQAPSQMPSSANANAPTTDAAPNAQPVSPNCKVCTPCQRVRGIFFHR